MYICVLVKSGHQRGVIIFLTLSPLPIIINHTLRTINVPTIRLTLIIKSMNIGYIMYLLIPIRVYEDDEVDKHLY